MSIPVRDTRPAAPEPAGTEAEAAQPPVPSPALADPRLRLGRHDVLRAALARQAQATIGNRAVANILARSTPTAAPPAKHFTGAEIDAVLAKSPFLASYIKPQADAGQLVAGEIHFHPHAEFITRCIAYMKGKQNPDTKQTFTDDEARAYADSVRGFHDDAADEIHIDQDAGDRVTDLHEAIHHYSHATWRAKTGRNVNEGVTECFTRRLCKETGTPNPTPSYPKQSEAAFGLIGATSWELVAAAFFNGEVTALSNRIDENDPTGFGAFYGWLLAVDEGRYADAEALLPRPK